MVVKPATSLFNILQQCCKLNKFTFDRSFSLRLTFQKGVIYKSELFLDPLTSSEIVEKKTYFNNW